PCPPGSFAPQTGMPFCYKARPGRYVAGHGAVTDTDCPTGATPGSYANGSGSKDQTKCPKGTFMPQKRASRCYQAQPGYYVAGEGATAEAPCGLLTYQPQCGQASCLPVDSGEWPAATPSHTAARASRYASRPPSA
ncbi:hypothetical protein JKP88DRAFT_177193, partial [Tribonema minus]